MPHAPLWKPTQEELDAARLSHFQHWVAARYQMHFEGYEDLHRWSVSEPEAFWQSLWDYFDIVGNKGAITVQHIERMPGARWFPEAKLNFAQNLLRYADETPEAIALSIHNENGPQGRLTYADLKNQVASLATHLRSQGISKGDRVAAVTTNSEHAIIAMLAATSIGAVWSSCSPDFGVSGILDRFTQIAPKALIACTHYMYAGKTIDCRQKLDEVIGNLDTLTTVISFNPVEPTKCEALAHNRQAINTMTWDQCLDVTQAQALSFEPLAFNDPLYILYSSGTTGKPKCIVHGVGGTLVQHLKELAFHSDVGQGSKLFYFTTCGWMMWNWYISGLALGATIVAYDGSPFHPEQTVLFDLAEKEAINVFGVSAKYFAAAEKFGIKPVNTHTLTSVRGILSTGSPLVPESFDYIYRDVAPHARVSSISGGTDIVSCFALGVPTLPVYRGELQSPGLGMDVHFVDDDGSSLESGKGELVCRTSFPSMPIYFWGDENGQRYKNAYFSRFDNTWAHGDFGELRLHVLDDGSVQHGVIIHGRSDAVLNPNGVRIGTAEIYRQVEQVDEVFESIAIGQRWDGDERIVLFVRLMDDYALDTALSDKIKHQIRAHTSPRHVPAKIVQVSDIPRTRSGKIVELAVRSVVHGEEVKNTEAIANPEALALFKALPELSS